MTDKAQQIEINEMKHTEFASKLTVIKGRKDAQESKAGTISIQEKKTSTTWSMPEQLTGYIKCREFDFL